MEHFFYQDDKKEEIKEEFLTGKAESWALGFLDTKYPAELKKKNKRAQNKKLTSTQLRKFHIEVKQLEERVRNIEIKDRDKEFSKIKPLVKMLKSKVAYACPNTGRDRKVPEEFRKYIENMVDNIHDHRDFMAFALCFEAVVGYFYGQGGR